MGDAVNFLQSGVFTLLILGGLILAVFALIDAIRVPEQAFPAAGKRTKNLWLIILGVSIAVIFAIPVLILKIAGIVAAMGLDPVDFGPLRMARQIETLQQIYMIPLVQNRPWNWEFYFRSSDQYRCYLSGNHNAEAAVHAFDADNLAVFPEKGPQPAACDD